MLNWFLGSLRMLGRALRVLRVTTSQVRNGAISLARPEGAPPLVGWGVAVRPEWVAAAVRRVYDPQAASKTGGGL